MLEHCDRQLFLLFDGNGAYLAHRRCRMLWFLGALLIVFWVIGLAFKVTTGLIHVALIAGLILFILGFFRGRRSPATP